MVVFSKRIFEFEKFFHNKMTAFVRACSSGRLPEAQAIYAEGAPHADDLYAALRLACVNDQLHVAKWLSTVYEFFDFSMEGLFLIACLYDYMDMAQWLADEGCNPHCHDQDGSSAMFRACAQGSMRMVEWLYGKGVTNLMMMNHSGLSLLWAACTSDNVHVCQWLYERCPEIIHLVDHRMDYPMMTACKRGNMKMVKWLLPHSNINHKNGDGYTALWFACYYGHIDVVKWLVENGAVVAHVYSRHSPLMAACMHGSVELMKFFLEGGYVPGRLELLTASERDHVPLLEWLIHEIGHERVTIRKQTMIILLSRFKHVLRTHSSFQVFISRFFLGNNLVKELIAEFVGVVRGRKLRNVRECVAFW
jgi:ankyrin repeat protein